MNVICSFPRILRREIKAKGSITIHVNLRRGDDSGIFDCDLGNAAALIRDRNLVGIAHIARCDFADAFKPAV